MATTPSDAAFAASSDDLYSKNSTAPSASRTAKLCTQAPVARKAEVTRKKLSTEELANIFCVKPQTVRAGLCRNSHYLGLKPLKLPNGKLLWDAAEVECLLSGEVV